MPETPVLAVWNAIQALHSGDLVMYFFMRSFRIQQCSWNRKWKSIEKLADLSVHRIWVVRPEARHMRSPFPSVWVSCVELQWCSLWAQLALDQRRVKPAWRSPSHRSCRFHSFSLNTRHGQECLCASVYPIMRGWECNHRYWMFSAYFAPKNP